MKKSSNRGIKSTALRKPLTEISNGREASSSSSISMNKQDLDRLLHIRSDLSQLLAQIDDLVAKASECKTVSRTASQDIQSFENFLSNVISSLKPWALRFEKAFGMRKHQISQPLEIKSRSCSNKDAEVSPEQIKEPDMDLLVSPSPLVSWHAGVGAYKVECGKQLFMLTPLPKSSIFSSRHPATPKATVRALHEEDHHFELLPAPPKELHFDTSEQIKKDEQRKVFPSCNNVAKTIKPCLKPSSDKTIAFLDIVPKNISSQVKVESGSSDDQDSGELSRSVASRYQELLGLKHPNNHTTRREEDNDALEWFLSPPKTVVLLEPTDEKQVPTPPSNSGAVFATPLWMNVESTVRKGKLPGENTLKKELWTRFEQLATDGTHYDASKFQKSTRKGFMDMLEEASCEEASDPDGGVARKR